MWRPPLDPKSALELLYPGNWVSAIADKESKAKIHYRPVLMIHKWWARRLGVVFRTILKLLMRDASEVRALEDTFSDFEGFKEWYTVDDDAGGRVLLDPFMGGGTTLVEGSRLGFDLVGCDLNPVAWFLVKKELDPLDIPAFAARFEELDASISRKILSYHRTKCVVCGEQADAMYWFWVKVATCGRCGTKVRLFKDYVFMEPRERRGSRKTFLCPDCSTLFEADTGNGQDAVECPACCRKTPVRGGGPVKGKYFTCPSCGEKESFVEYVERGEAFELELYACEYYCPNCDAKGVKSPDEGDFETLERAQGDFERLRTELPLPDQPIPPGFNTRQVIKHGFVDFGDLFTQRQLLCLGLLYREILSIEDPKVREFFILTFSGGLEFNNLLCSYARAKRHLYNAFKSHTLHPPLMPCENNPWGTKYGRGIFRTQVEHTSAGKMYARAPYELLPSGEGRPTRHPTPNPVDTRVYLDPGAWNLRMTGKRRRGALLLCGDSSELPLEPASVDYVVTDPPYYDNVMYSELADFYYVWQRLGLAEYYPHFSPRLTPKADEVIKNQARGLTAEHYGNRLAAVFGEAARVLKKDGILVFTFHHRDFSAWERVLVALVRAGFGIVASHPVRAENQISTSIIYKNSVVLDLILVCRRRPPEYRVPAWKDGELLGLVNEMLEEAAKGGGVARGRGFKANSGGVISSLGDVNDFVLNIGSVVAFLSWNIDPDNPGPLREVLGKIKGK
ncbi:MAG: hypothetical protein ACTSU5_00385 [Promethearchaeota archaeon]